MHDENNELYEFEAYGLECITGALSTIDSRVIRQLFPNLSDKFVRSLLRGTTVDFLIGVFAPDLAVAFFLASALALLLEVGDFGAAMILWSLLGWGWGDTVIKVDLLVIISLLQEICICANYVQISHMTTIMISAL